MEYHYTYELINTKNNMNYIGVRSCECQPKDDIHYFGSSKAVDEELLITPVKYWNKLILKIFKTRQQAVKHEIELHSKFNVAVNPQFYNKAKQTATGFDRSGTTMSSETKDKISKANKGETSFY